MDFIRSARGSAGASGTAWTFSDRLSSQDQGAPHLRQAQDKRDAAALPFKLLKLRYDTPGSLIFRQMTRILYKYYETPLSNYS